MKMEQSVPKLWHLNYRHRGITQKKAQDIQNTAKVLNQEQAWVFTGVPAYSAEEKEKIYSAVMVRRRRNNTALVTLSVPTLQYLKLLSNLSTQP
jgi:predicted aconitase